MAESSDVDTFGYPDYKGVPVYTHWPESSKNI